MDPLKILSIETIRAWDEFTIKENKIRSIDLMENAALACAGWIDKHFENESHFTVFCGMGNNGGDGLALARMLMEKGKSVDVYILRHANQGSSDFEINKNRLKQVQSASIKELESIQEIQDIKHGSLIIDALLGSGLNKVPSGLLSACIRKINACKQTVIAIDMPSGLHADQYVLHREDVIEATYTLSFEIPKLSFLFAENASYVGEWILLPIGLSELFYLEAKTDRFLLNKSFISSLIKKTNKFDHKGKNGHLLLIAGSKGKIGAAILAVQAGLRSGAGLVSYYGPGSAYTIVQAAAMEALFIGDQEADLISQFPDTEHYQAIGIGPGIGKEKPTVEAFLRFLQSTDKPLVLDADALNILSENPSYLHHLPTNTILTPHLKEFERLSGKSHTDFERFEKQIQFSITYGVFVILKGAHTSITCPDGKSYFNNTGNEGMAKGGSGDILTGLVSGCLAQGYSALHAALLGVYLHGLAGDLAAEVHGKIALKSGDLLDYISRAFLELNNSPA